MENETKRKYLHITIGDNDFSRYWDYFADGLYSLLYDESFPELTDEMLRKLDHYIVDVWYSNIMIARMLRKWEDKETNYKEYIRRRLTVEVVGLETLDDWDNGEHLFIALFDVDDKSHRWFKR